MYLLEREACPIGFSVDSWISKEELMSLDVNLRAVALLDSVVLDKNEISNSDILEVLPENNALDINTSKTVGEYVAEITSRSVNNFSKDGHGFTCKTDYERDSYVYFSVPYDKGWNAFIDGKKTDIIVSGGMMLIRVPSGIHNIEFSYYTPGLKIGLIISILSMVIFLAFLIMQKGKSRVNSFAGD